MLPIQKKITQEPITQLQVKVDHTEGHRVVLQRDLKVDLVPVQADLVDHSVVLVHLMVDHLVEGHNNNTFLLNNINPVVQAALLDTIIEPY